MEEKAFIELVQKAIAALNEQGKGCTNREGSCVYLNQQGHKCIVGHMMPNDETRIAADDRGEYNDEITSIRGLRIKKFPWIEQFSGTQLDLLEILQDIHDGPSGLTEKFFDDAITKMKEEVFDYASNL